MVMGDSRSNYEEMEKENFLRSNMNFLEKVWEKKKETNLEKKNWCFAGARRPRNHEGHMEQRDKKSLYKI